MKRKKEAQQNSPDKEPQAKRKKEALVIDLLEDDSDDELQQAIKMSLQQPKIESTPQQASSSNSAPTPTVGKYFGDRFYLNKFPGATGDHLLSVEDVLDLKNVKSCFFSTYSFELQYFKRVFASIINPPRNTTPKCTSVTLVKHFHKPEEQPGKTIMEAGALALCIIHPELPSPYSNVHSKLWILQFDEYLRVVVTSGNLTSFDWDYYSQTFWIQDFPKKEKNKTYPEPNQFEKSLFNFWDKIASLPSNWLKVFDFSGAKAQLICSVPGYHRGDKEKVKYGHMQLKNCVSAFKISKPVIYFQSSTIGSADSKWCSEISRSLAPKTLKPESQLKLIYPTVKQVKDSKAGLVGAGMIRCKQKSAEELPKGLLCGFVNQFPSQQNFLAHTKIVICANSAASNSDKNEHFGYCYLGSHNFSPAAWGRLQKNDTQLFILNYEIGVVLPFSCKVDSNSSLTSSFPIPFVFPPQVYTKDETAFTQA